MQFSCKILPEEAGKRLDIFLGERFSYRSRAGWQKAIANGEVTVNAISAKPGCKLKAGSIIEFQPGEVFEPPVSCDFRVLFEDECILLVDKPGDLPVHPAGRYRQKNLLSFLIAEGFGDLFPIHRLDRETSGIVIFAKSAENARKLSFQMQKHLISKSYIAYVWGKFPERTLKAEGYLVSDESSQIRKKRKFLLQNILKGETSLTWFRRLKCSSGISKLYCKLGTGRTHQIRATLLSLGYPLLGDKIYGKDESAFLQFIDKGDVDLKRLLGMERQALHCSRVSFCHPESGKKITQICEEPEDMRRIL